MGASTRLTRVNGSLRPFPDAPTSLFTLDFGQEPHLLVGREGLVSSLRVGLGTGPRDPRFTSLLLGPRGSGKTVVLNHLGSLARESGWIVLPLDAGTAGVQERIIEYILWAREISTRSPTCAAFSSKNLASTSGRTASIGRDVPSPGVPALGDSGTDPSRQTMARSPVPTRTGSKARGTGVAWCAFPTLNREHGVSRRVRAGYPLGLAGTARLRSRPGPAPTGEARQYGLA